MSADHAEAKLPPAQTCGGCAHWRPLPRAASVRAGKDGEVGECHAGPPMEDFHFVRTGADGWCGYQRPAEGKAGKQ
jgi:hypothetical protein